MWVSPRHIRDKPPETVDEKIEIFIAQVDGWHLEVADRCINGWQVNGQECISAIDLKGNRTKHIPDSGWAALQMVLNYFEVIGYYKLGIIEMKWGASAKRFDAGVLDVFPHLENYSANVPEQLRQELRNGLYHVGISGRVILRHVEPIIDISYDKQLGTVIIDPHAFIPSLRAHFRAYATQLRNPLEVEIRTQFNRAFDTYHNQIEK